MPQGVEHHPTVVFCTTCKGRLQHLEQTLPQNIAANQGYPNCKFVVLDYASPDGLAQWLKAHQGPNIASGKLAVYSYVHPGKFRMAHAKNMAHRCGVLEGADILVNLDADNYTGHGFAQYLVDSWKPGCFMSSWMRGIRGASGRIAVSRDFFLKAGGYDERFDTWGPDDKDFSARLIRLGYTSIEIAPQYLNVILHNHKMRFRDYPEVRPRADTGESDLSINDSTATIANFGKFGEGTVYRNFDRTPIELGPLPTRIFGIGMHKTATTSLHTALNLLGYDSAHWKNAHWAKLIWKETTTAGRSRTLERSYALCDLPIPLIYKELDRSYPGSKFILTMREERRWLQSVRNHWSPAHNKFRARWDIDPFSHKVHKLLYGRKNFDEAIFLARYRRHNAEVREYFEDRSQDLLVMDMDSNAGWPELCGFLKQPIPAAPYPYTFKIQDHPPEAEYDI